MVDSQIDELIGEYQIPGEDEIIRDYVRLFEAHFSATICRKACDPGARFTPRAMVI
jgi:hypothetical protein